MIRKGTDEDFEEIFNIINDAAMAYNGIIPPDRWHEPYMTKEELQTLIRHAYVRTKQRNKGIGTLLLRELIRDSTKPILIGTWKAADWAIRFYEKHGFCLIDEEEKNRLLKKYWAIPDRQIETSVVLVDAKYKESEEFLATAST